MISTGGTSTLGLYDFTKIHNNLTSRDAANAHPASSILDSSGRNQQDKNSDFKTLQDNGAFGDGTSKTLQHWVDIGKFSNLTAVQVVYPNATSLTETIDAVCLQDLIDKNYGTRVYIKPKKYNINKPIVIKQGISIVADQRATFPYGYTATTAKLDFSTLPADSYAITISGFDAVSGQTRITGVELDGFLMIGAQTVNAIKIGQDINHDVTELIIRNTVVQNFKDALNTTYLYGATFSAFRAQSCVNGFLLGSQTNQVLFDRCAAVTISDKALSFTNCEGIQFSSPNISNLTKADGAPITTYQSQVITTNPYFENITYPILVQVGSRTENANIASSFIIDQALKIGEIGSYHDIRITNKYAYAEIRGKTRFGARIVGVDISTPHLASFVDSENLKETTQKYIEHYPIGKYKTYVQYGGGVLSQSQGRGFIRVNNTGVVGTGLRLSETMVIGELYTLTYAIKANTADPATVSLRIGSSPNVLMTINASSDPTVDIVHCSFVATDPNLRMLFTGIVDVYGYTLQKGNRTRNDVNLILPSADRITVDGSTIPTVTGWLTGDLVLSTATTSGTAIGWICTNGGTNTWISLGFSDTSKMVTQSNSVATDVAGVVTDLNALIAKLKTSKLMS